jgi:ankyrin repeat protein
MEHLFDPDKPYFAAWRGLRDIDVIPPYGSAFRMFGHRKSGAITPLYYAALCGFANLVEQLMSEHPQHVNAIGGRYGTPAVAALAGRHFELAQVLHRNKSSMEPRGDMENTPLHSVARCGDLEMVQVLLEYGVDINAKNKYGSTPLDYAIIGSHHNKPKVVRLLVEHGADPNSRGVSGYTPLHRSIGEGVEIVRLLIEHGGNVEIKTDGGRTTLDIASDGQREEILELFRKRGYTLPCSTSGALSTII